MENIERYIEVVPSDRQYEIQKMGFYAFIHYGMNTYLDKEWSDGTASSETFAPTDIDVDGWCEAVKSAGMKGIILTAKHHDGFCLWQTKTTDYSVASSPYKDGKGDVVKELSEACRRHDLKFGVYLSPWDRHSEYYGTDKYNDFYIEQLTELLTNYGDIFEVWLDGACGSHLDGKPVQKYDFKRIYETVRKYQPKCIIANCGPDVRWVGNEAGLARVSEWNVLPYTYTDIDRIMASSQQDESPSFDLVDQDLGSRKALEGHDHFVWYPAEVDVSIRPGWFYHESEDNKVKKTDELLDIYYNSVGGNAMLLLNIPPAKDGKIADSDKVVLKELGERIASGLGERAKVKSVRGSTEKADYKISNIVKGGVYSPEISDKYAIEIDFKEISKIDKVVLREDIRHSQRIEEFEIYVRYRNRCKHVFKGTTVGMCKVCRFDKWTYADGISILIKSSRNEPYIAEVSACIADGKLPKQHKISKMLKRMKSAIGYKFYTMAINRKKKKVNR